jgi:hypothetical protein
MKRKVTQEEVAPTLLGEATPVGASTYESGPAAHAEGVRAIRSTIGHYVIERVVGVGGKGVVY